ncbi:MAG TPA: sugar ABC transporter permease [Chloroflexota bacterium]|nr:sugar ABC transporter permease [Chloroflexota bacterium]
MASPATTGQRADAGLLNRLSNSRGFLSIALLLPALAVLLFVFAYPVARTFVMAFQSVNLTRADEGTPFIGLGNYLWLVDQELFWLSLGNTVLLTVLVIVLELSIGMVIALLLVEPFPGLSIVRGIFILPWAIPNIVVAWLMRMYLQPRFGLANQLIAWFGNTLGIHEGHFLLDWLGNATTALLTVSLIITWKGLPFVILVLLAGLQSIPREQGEAARIDGANAWQEFRYITLPSLKLIILVVTIFRVIGTFNSFDLVWLLTGGGPGNATRVLAVEVYNRAFVSYQMGRAASLTTLMFLFLGLMVFVLLTLQREEAERAA